MSDKFNNMHLQITHFQAALDHLLQRPDLDPTRIVVFGRSLGGAVGSALVKSNPGKVQTFISRT